MAIGEMRYLTRPNIHVLFYIILFIFAESIDAKELTKINVIGNNNDDSEPKFYLPTKVILGPEGNLYVLDVGNTNIKVVTTKGDYVRTIGGPGQGPGEFKEPVDIWIEDNNLWVLDHSQMKISLFNLRGSYIFSFAVEIMPFAFTFFNNSFICSHVIGENFLIEYELTGSTSRRSGSLTSYDDIMDISRQNPFQRMAYLASDRGNNIFISYLYKNKIDKYDNNLNLIKTVKLSDGKKEPLIHKNTNMYYVEGTEISSGINYVNETIYVLWKKENSDQLDSSGNSVITAFDDELNKIESMNIPDCLKGFTITDSMLYGTVEDPYPAIVIYKR